MPLNSLVSEAFVHFFVEIVGHYSLHMNVTEKGERVFQREPFRKSHMSRNVRHFLHFFMETQMFGGFIQEREMRKQGVRGEGLCRGSARALHSWKLCCHSQESQGMPPAPAAWAEAAVPVQGQCQLRWWGSCWIGSRGGP